MVTNLVTSQHCNMLELLSTLSFQKIEVILRVTVSFLEKCDFI